MRKFTGVLVGIFTFFLGVSIYFVFLNAALHKSKPLVEPVDSSSLPVISLCDATRNPRLFENGNIRLRVRLSGQDGYGYSVSESKGNCHATITFLLTEESKAGAGELFQQLTARYLEGSSHTFAEVEVVGKLTDYHKYGISRFAGQFEIEAKEIKQISPVKQLTLTEYLSEQNR